MLVPSLKYFLLIKFLEMSETENNEVDELAENHEVDEPDDLEDYEDEFEDDNVEEEMDAYESLDLVSIYIWDASTSTL